MNMLIEEIRTNIDFNEKYTIKAWLEKKSIIPTQNWETFIKEFEFYGF